MVRPGVQGVCGCRISLGGAGPWPATGVSTFLSTSEYGGLYQGTASAVPTDLHQKEFGFSPCEKRYPTQFPPRTHREFVA